MRVNFYSNEEFQAQMTALTEAGMSELAAYAQVRKQEQEDALEYERWVKNRQDADFDEGFYDEDYA